jgi:hypothetical protein
MCYCILIGKPDGEELLGNSQVWMEDVIKMHLGEI